MTYSCLLLTISMQELLFYAMDRAGELHSSHPANIMHFNVNWGEFLKVLPLYVCKCS